MLFTTSWIVEATAGGGAFITKKKYVSSTQQATSARIIQKKTIGRTVPSSPILLDNYDGEMVQSKPVSSLCNNNDAAVVPPVEISSPPLVALQEDEGEEEERDRNNDNNINKSDDDDDGCDILIDNFEVPQSRWVCPSHEDVCTQTGVTLSRYMMEMVRANRELEDVESIFTSLQVACKTISKLIKTASLTGILGYHDGGGSINVQGEEQKKLDVIANDVLKRAFQWTGKFATLASEEEDTPVSTVQSNIIRDTLGNPVYSGDVLFETEGRFVAAFDPLDGSSNVDAGIPVGTIFGIFERNDSCDIDDFFDDQQQQQRSEVKCLQDSLQPGNNLVAAGYCLYSSATTLVFTLGNGVNGFTLDETIGEFVLTHPNMTIPSRGKIYSFNEANRWDWDLPLQQYITNIQQGRGETNTKYSSRYVGSMVADVHRTLQYGGIFGYPADNHNPDGKLRLLYEAAPMSFLFEQAGGLAISGKTRIMDIPPKEVHQRVPCILGSREDVKECRKYYQASTDQKLIARCEKRLNP